jgi:cholesterol transport system auxiliary component
MKRIVIVAIAAAAATGCIHVGSESKSEKIETFRLSPPAIEAGAATPRVDALAVSRPRAAPALDTTSIAISRPGQAFDYYEGVRWAESTPAMVQQLLVQSLASAGIYTAVVTAPTRVPFNQLLDVELRRFEAVSDSDASPPRVVVQLQFTLVDAKRGQRLGSGVATGEAAATENRRGAVIAAWQQAMTAALVETVARVREAASAAPAPATPPAAAAGSPPQASSGGAQ